MFKKILIANRGEIACRIMRSAKRLGIRTVAVYSEADEASLHVTQADEARLIGPAPARQSYLNAERILAAARESGAEAIHPGYGFLSENADFAELVERAGLVFIGPPSGAIRAMGSKSAAKELMRQAGVAVVPGYHGSEQDDSTFAKAARKVGYPVLIKAVFGGGGKGMRRVEAETELADSLTACRREAKAAFGNDALLVEKYLAYPRHIEMQIFADRQGNIVHLFERDCSLQRRHQKVVEEAPAPGVDAKSRAALGAAAIAAARAVGYVGAGTVEFIAEAGALDRCYFMEMNTRLQVEHPVTEAITGLDLVEWQLRIAAGEALPLAQDDIRVNGHAIEVRLCAEDPALDFRPAMGRIRDWFVPMGPGLRCDSGIATGSEIGAYYDSLLAKLIAWGETRAQAIERLSACLAGTRLAGIASNLDFLGRCLDHPDFRAGRIETGFIPAHLCALAAQPAPDDLAWIMFGLAEQLRLAAGIRQQVRAARDPNSPWLCTDNWRLGGQRPIEWRFSFLDDARTIILSPIGEDWLAGIGDRQMRISAIGSAPDMTGREISAKIDGVPVAAHVVADGEVRWLHSEGHRYRVTALGNFSPPPVRRDKSASFAGEVLAPMPGRVVAFAARVGENVIEGQQVLVLEAMKMEHAMSAPIAGRVAAFFKEPGEMVEEGALLARIETTGSNGTEGTRS